MSHFSKIYSNAFFQEIDQDIKNMILSSETKDGDFDLERIVNNPVNNYITSVNMYVRGVIETLKPISYSIIFLRAWPNITNFRKEYQRSEWIRYHLEAYFVNVSSLLDKILLLTNAVYSLGFEDTDVRYPLIVNNKNIADYPIVSHINNLSSVIKKIRVQANRAKHHNRYTDQKLSMITITESLLLNQKINFPIDRRFLLHKNIEKKTKSYLKAIEKIVLERNASIARNIDNAFTSLKVKYESKKYKLQKVKTLT